MPPEIMYRAISRRFDPPDDIPGFSFFGSPVSPVTLFHGLSATILPGERVAITGKNGSGKTTFLRATVGLSRLSSGEIRIGSHTPRTFDRRSIGVFLRMEMLYSSLTGRQNLEYSAHLFDCEKPKESVLRTAAEWGLDKVLDLPVKRYSSGYRTRLALARATIQSPSLLVLDEPDSYLDGEGFECLKSYLKSGNHTALVSTQSPENWGDTFHREIRL